jgi:hypothetical protein
MPNVRRVVPRFLDDYEIFVENDTIVPDKVVEKIFRSKGTVDDLIDLYNHCVFGDEEDFQRTTMKRHLAGELRDHFGYFVPKDDYLRPDSRCHILALPRDVRLIVMRQLELRDLITLAKTCRTIFGELSGADWIVECDLQGRNISDAGLGVLLRNFRKLTNLDLSWCGRITVAVFSGEAACLANLQELDLTNTSVTAADQEKILKRCLRLIELKITVPQGTAEGTPQRYRLI